MSKVIFSLVKFDKNMVLDEKILYKYELDTGTKILNGKNKGLLVFLPDHHDSHLHYYVDNITGEYKAYINNQKSYKRIPYDPSLRRLNKILVKRALKEMRKNS